MEKSFLIETQNLTKIYGLGKESVNALNDFTIKIYPGEIVGFLGPNGAGKSTFMKIIATILLPDSGSIYINKKNLYDFSETELIDYKKNLGFLPEMPFIYSNLTGYEYLNFIGEIYGVEKNALK